ncbi:hypothetical protein GCM10028796_34190 [Ramlibacter monticola]
MGAPVTPAAWHMAQVLLYTVWPLPPAPIAAVLLAPASMEDPVADEDDARLPEDPVVDGVLATLALLLSLEDGAVARLALLSLDEGALVDGDEEVDAVVAASSSWRPQPVRTAATARAVAASVSFFIGSLPCMFGWR